MSKTWLKDEPLKICPISGGVPSENSGNSIDPKVTNGSAFDCYGFSFGGIDSVMIPASVEVNNDVADNTMIVKTNKRLGFKGHPPAPMSPETARKNMGIAYKIKGNTLHIATYGEFSTEEGGASMKLVISLPAGLKIARTTGYTGEDSEAATHDMDMNAKEYWYTGTKAAAGWIALKAVPDPGSR